MASLTWVLLLLLSVSRLARSEENFKNNWIEPDGNKNDFEQTFYVGDTLNIQWAGWDSWYIETFMENSTQANLYVVAWNADVSSFFRILKSETNILSSASYSWKIDIGDDDLATTTEYCVTFIPISYSYDTNAPQMYSPGFNIKKKPTTSSTSSTTAPTASSTTTPTASSSSNKDGLQTGAKAGIGIGAGVGGLAVFSALGFLLFRRRQSSQGVTASPGGPAQALAKGDYPKVESQELFVAPAEAPGEVPSRPAPLAELPVTGK